MITAPFNFVPLSEKIFFPDWAEQVSHDVPFEDSQSGVIDITLTAKSPIFVRDGKEDTKFCHHNGTAYIPSSSVKGMVRSVLEIMSFSKMSQFNDDTYAVRDLRNRELYMSKMTPDNTYCGFLKKVDGKYYIEDCGKPGRIKHEEIDKIYNMNFASKFKHGVFGNKAKDKTAKVKYEMIKSENFEHNFSYFKKDVNREIYKYHPNGKQKGTLVLTGQPSARNEPQGRKPSGKVYEFIFFESKGDITLSEGTLENFKFAYFDGRDTEPKESPDWTFWKKKLESGQKVPVFFQKNGKEIAHFGLSYLYKLPYANSVSGGIPTTHNDNRKDLAQTIFGYAHKDEALKGRVQFSHFKAVSGITELNQRIEILGTPRASYYPIYVKQKDGKLFTTFMDSGFNISGRKRYPIHQGSGVKKTPDTGNENVGTAFRALKEGVVFQGKLRYHNLKKAELGAMLSALTFHGTSNCYHIIGMAKSLGYGKVELKINGIELEEYLKTFELEMTSTIPNWAESEQLTELLTMATEQNNNRNSRLEYMNLLDFAKNKTGDKDYLRNYTALDNIKAVMVRSLITQEDLEVLKVVQAQKAEAERLHQEEQQRALKEEQDWEIIRDSSNIATIEAFVKKYAESKYTDEANQKIKMIKEENERLKLLEGEKEAIEKWEKIHHPSNKKYLKDALSRFIEDYPNSSKVSEAQKELEEMSACKTKTTNQKLDFSLVNDGKSIERVIKPVQNPSDEDKDLLEEAIKRIYPSLNAKKKKQFMRSSKLMVKWLGQDRFDGITNDER